MNEGHLTDEWDDYLTVLREDAHQLLAWSYIDTRQGLRKAGDEYELTGLLADGMNRRIADPLTPDRFLLYSIHNERPIAPRGELGKKRPKLDIQIERCGVRPKRFYTFEAKRLRDDEKSSVASSAANYFGEEGVGRFISERYEADSAEAAMLGCIQAHNAEFWFQRFSDFLDEDISSARNQLRIAERLHRCSVILQLGNEAATVHHRSSGSIIRLLHILLDCT
jgi:hypothetical protein